MPKLICLNCKQLYRLRSPGSISGYRCKQCGGSLSEAPEASRLQCPSCQRLYELTTTRASKAAVCIYCHEPLQPVGAMPETPPKNGPEASPNRTATPSQPFSLDLGVTRQPTAELPPLDEPDNNGAGTNFERALVDLLKEGEIPSDEAPFLQEMHQQGSIDTFWLKNHYDIKSQQMQESDYEIMDQVSPLAFGPYRTLYEIGQGSTGIVYKGWKVGSDCIVAIKRIRPERMQNPVVRQRFAREIQYLRELSHPNILPILDGGEDHGDYFLVMPFVETNSLAQRLAQLSGERPDEVIRPFLLIVIRIAWALEYAHSKGLVHRDVKPSNILLEGDEPFLADFGLAKSMERTDPSLTQGPVGTPCYMAPEQWAGHCTPQSDIYALGVILYEIATKHYPYPGSTPEEIMSRQAKMEPTPPSHYNPLLREGLDAVILKAIEKRPRDRYATASALSRDLQRVFAGEKPQARPPGLSRRLRRLAANPPQARTWFFLAVAMLVVGIPLALLWQSWRYTHRENAAYQEGRAVLIEAFQRLDDNVPLSEVEARFAEVLRIMPAKAHYVVYLEIGKQLLSRLPDELSPRHSAFKKKSLEMLWASQGSEPRHLETYYWLWQWYALQGKEDAEELYRALESLEKSDETLYAAFLTAKLREFRAAREKKALVRAQEEQRTLQQWSKIIAGQPDFAPAYLQRGRLHRRQDHLELAQEDFEQAIARSPKSSLAYTELAILHRQAGRFAKAAGALKIALDFHPYFIPALLEQAHLYQAQGEPVKAAEQFAQILKIDETSWPAYFHRGTFFWKEGRHIDALDDFQKSLLLATRDTLASLEDWSIVQKLGQRLLRENQKDLAEEVFERLRELNQSGG